MDITPMVPAGRQVIQSYGNGQFVISGVSHTGAVLVLLDETVAWPVASIEGLNPGNLGALLDRGDEFDLLLMGCGTRPVRVGDEIRERLSEIGVTLEAMDTGAACRTFNVLVIEERRVAAALLPVD